MNRATLVEASRRTAEELIVCLQGQAEQFRAFLELLQQQRDALVKRDSHALDRIVAEQETAIAESRRLEQRRRALTAKLTAALGEGGDEQTLRGLAQLVNASDASRLTEVQEQLGGLQREIEQRKKVNQALIEQSMRCTGEAMKWIAQRVRPKPVYGPQSATTNAAPGHIAINRNC